MRLKIGDEVKVVYNSNGSGIVKAAMNKVGIIFRIPKNYEMVYIKFDEEIWSGLTVLGFHRNEIEKMPRKGEQLLLFEL